MKKKIKIPVLVGSNGKWSAMGVLSEEEMDWSLLGDHLDKDGKYPVTEKRYWVEAEIEVPSEEVESVTGEVSSADPQEYPKKERRENSRIENGF